MKQSRLFRLIALLMLPVLCIGLAACGGDDDEPDSKDPIVGTWYYCDEGDLDLKDSFTFNADKTGTQRFDYDGVHRDFVWEKTGQNTYIITDIDEDYQTVTMSGNTILIEGEGTYKKK